MADRRALWFDGSAYRELEDADTIRGHQPSTPATLALAALTPAADRLPYFTGASAAALATFTAGGRALVNSAGTANTFPYFSAANTVTLGSITAAGRALLDDADNAAQRTTLGLGSMATAAAADYALLAGATFTGDVFISGAGSDLFVSGNASAGQFIGNLTGIADSAGSLQVDGATSPTDANVPFGAGTKVYSLGTTAVNTPVAGGLYSLLNVARLSTSQWQLLGMASSSGGNQRLFFRGGAASAYAGAWSEVQFKDTAASFTSLALSTDLAVDTGDITTRRIRLSITSDASFSSTGHAFQIGPDSGVNLRVDGNEILAVNNGAASALYIQAEGGSFTQFSGKVSVAPAGTPTNWTLAASADGDLHLSRTATQGALFFGFDADAGRYIYGNGAQLRFGDAFTEVSPTVTNATTLGAAARRWSVIHTNGLSVSGATAINALQAGTYLPTRTGVTNVASTAAAGNAHWMRVGDTVTVSGRITVTPTAAVATRVAISLPVASALTSAEQCSGVVSINGDNAVGQVVADATGDRAFLDVSVFTNSTRQWHFVFTYIVL